MKNATILSKAALLGLAAAAVFGASAAYATVGGPTLVSEFQYNPADESVYYREQSFGGRGCPPVLKKLSLNTGENAVVFSCEDGEEFLAKQGESYNPNLVNAELSRMTEGFKGLSSISLKDNNIEVDVDFKREERFESDDFVVRRHFTASVYQSGEKIAEFPITGCGMDQPFLFGGYAIPGFEKKIVMLASAKSDCFEGGYIGESLHMVGGISGLDRSYSDPQSFKTAEPLVPSAATLVVFKEEEVSAAENEKSKNGGFAGLITSVIALIAGIMIGMLIGAKSRMRRR